MNNDFFKKNRISVDYILWMILLLSLFFRLWGINWGLPYLYQSEEYKIVNYTLKMLGNKTLNPHFFEYPSLYYYFMAVVYGIYFIVGFVLGVYKSASEFAVLFVKNPTGIYVVSRVIESLFGVGVVYLTFLTGKKVFNRRVGYLLAFFVAITPNLIDNCHKIKGDMAMLFLSLLFFYFLIQYYYEEKERYLLISGVVLGLSVSTKYLAIGMSVLIPVVCYFVDRRRNKFFLRNRNFYFAILLSITFFFLGSPFILISYKEFLETFKNIFVPRTDASKNIGLGFLYVLKHFLYIGDINENYFWLGLVGYLGFFNALYKIIFQKKEKYVLMILPVITYFFIVGRHIFPGKGFLFNAFPFFLMTGADFVDNFFYNKVLRWPVFVLLVLSIGSSLWVSFNVSYAFTLPDPRTEAKNWIEKNIPSGTAILIDMPVKSPQLVMEYSQLEQLYKKAIELNNYKKEYLYLKLQAFKDYYPTYFIYQVKRHILEVGAPPNLVEKAQEVQALLDVSQWDNLYKYNIQYIIVNDLDASISSFNSPTLAKFYSEVPNRCKLLKRFLRKNFYHQVPEVYVYSM